MAADESIVRFLIASDIHAGYGENKPYIGNDSFDTFREVLSTAREEKVDFILLGGDLFHENHPSRESQLKVVRLLRKYCLHNEDQQEEATTNTTDPNTTHRLDFVSDPTINFQHSNFPVVNYADTNLHVTMPIFTIHGNHDDLSGKGLSALDVLHEAGLINLFGKFSDVDQIDVSPILLRRGITKIALYGIGSQRDDRLARSFSKGHVNFARPDDEDPESWFCILVLHQNRPPRNNLRSTKSHLSFKHIPLFFDLVLWGHEHQCLIDPDFKYMDPNNDKKGFYIIQPGSTVATSMSPEEAGKKQIGTITVRGKEFKLKKHALQTTRQVLVDELALDEVEPAPKLARSTVRQRDNMRDERLIAAKIDEMLADAEKTRGPQQPQPPRLRLKVTYAGKWLDIPPINGRKFGATRYADKVANAPEMIAVRSKHSDKKARNLNESTVSLRDVIEARAQDVCSVDDMVNKFFEHGSFENRLTVLSEVQLGKQLQEYSNTELAGTQFKFSTADKALSECIRTQIDTLSARVKQMVQQQLDQNLSEADEEPLEQQIAKAMAAAKKQRVQLPAAGPQNTTLLNSSVNTEFFERELDPARMVTSTPLPTRERAMASAQQPHITPMKRTRRGTHNNITLDALQEQPMEQDQNTMDADFDSP